VRAVISATNTNRVRIDACVCQIFRSVRFSFVQHTDAYRRVLLLCSYSRCPLVAVPFRFYFDGAQREPERVRVFGKTSVRRTDSDVLRARTCV